jgi:hypothetical protein
VDKTQDTRMAKIKKVHHVYIDMTSHSVKFWPTMTDDEVHNSLCAGQEHLSFVTSEVLMMVT